MRLRTGFLLTALCLCACGTVLAAKQPNILFILADDVGAEASSLQGYLAGKSGAAPMPNIEKLAAGGLVFDNVWVNPMCSPTRATILTGLYGNHTGVLVAGDILDKSNKMIWDLIAEKSPAKYDMGVFGKWHLGGNEGTFQHVKDLRTPSFHGFLGHAVPDYYNWTAYDSTGKSEKITQYSTTVITDWTIDFLKKHQANRPNDPWFVYLPYNAAHEPFQVPPKDLFTLDVGPLKPGDKEASVRVYKAMIQALDTEIGRLLKYVDLKNTVVIYMGDNGTPSNVKDEGSKVRGSKTSVWEGGAKVSMMIAGPGVTRVGREPALVNGTDLYATVAALAGVSVTHINDSYSVVPLLTDAKTSTGREYGFTEFCTKATGKRKPVSRVAIRDHEYKLAYDSGEGWGLFDLLEDQGETNNVYDKPQYTNAQAKLRMALDQIKGRATAGCFP